MKTGLRSFRESVRFQFLLLLGSLAVCDIVARIILRWLAPFPPPVEALLDASLLTLLVFPFLYFIVVRPLTEDIIARRLTEEALRESELRYRETTQSAHDAIITADGAGRIIGWNSAAERMFGYTEAEARVMELVAIIPARFRDGHLHGVARVQSGGERQVVGQVVELAGLRRDGSEVPVELSLSEWDGANGPCFTSIIRDISERKRTEEALQKSAERFRNIFTAMNDGFSIQEVICDAAGKPCDLRFIEANTAFEQQTGLRNADTLGHTLLELFPQAESLWIERYGKVGLTGEPAHFEAMFGPLQRYYRVSAFQVEPGRFGVVFTDINDRKRNEQALRESEERLHRAVRNAPFPVMLHAEDGEVVMINETWTELTGYTRADIPTTAAWTKRAYGQQRELVQEEIERLYGLQEKLKEGVYVVRTKSGNQRSWDFMSAPLGRLSDERRMVVSMAVDVTDRMKADADLRESEERNRLVVENLDEGIAWLDASERFTYANPAAEGIFGVPPGGLRRHDLFEFISPDQFAVVQEQAVQRLAGVRSTYELQIRRPDGEERQLLVSSVPRFSPPGKFVGSFRVFRDISEHKRREAALRLSEEKFAAAFRDSPAGMAIRDKQSGCYLDVNDQCLAITGYSRAEVIGRSPLEIGWTPEADQQETRRLMTNPDGVREGELRLRHKKGHLVTCSYSSHEIRINGRPCMLSSTVDITARKQAEEAVRRSETALQAVLRSTADGLLAVSRDNRVLLANENFAKMWKVPPDMLSNEDDSGLLQHVLAQLVEPQAFLRKVQDLYQSADDSFDTLHFRDGRVFERLSRAIIEGGRIQGRVWSFRDVTEHKRAEAALRASLQEKEALLSEVHHRVKNNLQVIASLLRLETGQIDHPITQAVLREMQGRIRSMALLHETLYRTGNFAQIDLAAYFQDLCRHLFRSVGVSTGTVNLRLDLTRVNLGIDQAIPCGLIVNELASNCLKHGFPSGQTGEVCVGLHLVNGGAQIQLQVTDTGVGLPADLEFKRSKSLGLQLVADLARQLDGELAIGNGPGASFTVTFTPRHDASDPIPPRYAS